MASSTASAACELMAPVTMSGAVTLSIAEALSANDPELAAAYVAASEQAGV